MATKRRSTSGRKRSGSSTRRKSSSRKKSIDSNLNGLSDEIILFVLEAVFLLLFLAVLGFGGSIGDGLKKISFGLFGMCAYIFPVLLMIAGFYLYANIGNPSAFVKSVSATVLFIDLCMISHMMVATEQERSGMTVFLFSRDKLKGGGVVGGMIANMLTGLIGKAGTIVLIILSFIICFIVVTGISLLDAASSGRDIISERARESYDRGSQRYDEMVRRREEKERRREQVQNEEKKRRMDKKAQKGVSLDTALTDPLDNKASSDYEFKINDNENNEDTYPEQGMMNEIKISGYETDNSAEINDDFQTEPDVVEDIVQQESPIPFVLKNIQESGEEFDINSLNDKTFVAPALSRSKEIQNHSDEIMLQPIVNEDFENNNIDFNQDIDFTDDFSNEISAKDPSVKSKVTAVVPESNPIKKAQKKKKIKWRLPNPSNDDLLTKPVKGADTGNEELQETALKLQQTLKSFGVNVEMTAASKGPTVTRYEMKPEVGVKVSKILGLSDDIMLALAADGVRIEAPIPGKSAVGIEVTNKKATTVYMRELLESREYKGFDAKKGISFAVGKGLSGETIVSDISKMPHVLIAGATGSGKSVCINTLIMSILFKYTPDDIKIIMIDPKVVELNVYNGIPHLMIPVVTDPKQAAASLHWGVVEMDERYRRFADLHVRDLKGYNEKILQMKAENPSLELEPLPKILIIVDELADLMMVAGKEVEGSICRLAQLARACGIHLVIATQRPSVDVITGLIKANMPSRIAFAVSSGVDSRTVLDAYGAEKLVGRGDMLFYPQGYTKPARVQGAFVDDSEVNKVVDFWIKQAQGQGYVEDNREMLEQVQSGSISPTNGGSSNATPGDDKDEYFIDAAMFIIEKNKASIGNLQRRFKIGFNRAARIMDQLAEAGVVGEEEGTKPRKILMSIEELQNMMEQGEI